ncbi:hypothetical protein LT493_09280 [Streptomyces tricolor]|nr:hypothetical protein [Streptomyces tricolor]
MDYCPPCQRHLNGALACPGCGTPADRLAVTAAAPAPHAHGQPYQQSYGPYGHDEQPYEAAHEGTYAQPDRPGGPEHPDRSEEADEDGPEDAYETAEDTAPGGRRAARAAGSRRDRKAAVHRRRRRRTVLLAAGFVLAAGGLSLAELGTDAPFSPFSRDTPVPAGDTEAEGGAASRRAGQPRRTGRRRLRGRPGRRGRLRLARRLGLRPDVPEGTGEGLRFPLRPRLRRGSSSRPRRVPVRARRARPGRPPPRPPPPRPWSRRPPPPTPRRRPPRPATASCGGAPECIGGTLRRIPCHPSHRPSGASMTPTGPFGG